MLALVTLSFLMVLLLPGTSFAWGPAAHLELGRAVLSGIAGFAAPAGALIAAHADDFLYGNISADIVVGKNLAAEMKHCHNWTNGFKLLGRTLSDSQRAFAYGYLCHLAADTVAHNQFIPEMMIRSFSSSITRHIYWELRYDALVDRGVWRMPEKMARRVHVDNDRLLDSIIEDAPLSFATNRTIFSSILLINRVEHWHRLISALSRSSRWTLGGGEKERFFALSLEAVSDLLTHSGEAACVERDPTGRRNLKEALKTRRRLKAMRRRGKDWEGEMERAIEGLYL